MSIFFLILVVLLVGYLITSGVALKTLLFLGFLLIIYLFDAIIRVEKRIFAMEDLLGGIGVSGGFREKHGDIFSHAIELGEEIELLSKKVDVLEREKDP